MLTVAFDVSLYFVLLCFTRKTNELTLVSHTIVDTLVLRFCLQI